MRTLDRGGQQPGGPTEGVSSLGWPTEGVSSLGDRGGQQPRGGGGGGGQTEGVSSLEGRQRASAARGADRGVSKMS